MIYAEPAEKNGFFINFEILALLRRWIALSAIACKCPQSSQKYFAALSRLLYFSLLSSLYFSLKNKVVSRRRTDGGCVLYKIVSVGIDAGSLKFFFLHLLLFWTNYNRKNYKLECEKFYPCYNCVQMSYCWHLFPNKDRSFCWVSKVFLKILPFSAIFAENSKNCSFYLVFLTVIYAKTENWTQISCCAQAY